MLDRCLPPPKDLETYVHRVGRTGRNGARGRAVSLFEPRYWNGYLARELQVGSCGRVPGGGTVSSIC